MDNICLFGNQGVGKDTIANILINDHGYVKLAFASKVKDVVSILFGWDRYMLEGDTIESRNWREKIDIYWSEKLEIKDFTPRKALQTIGTDVFRDHFHNDIWLLIIENEIRKLNTNKIVITDCRFENEYEMLKKLGFNMVKVESTIYGDKQNTHTSNQYTNIFEYNNIIHNNKDIDYLKDQINILFNNNN